MRNFKKFLALVLAMLMLVSTAVITVGAADKTDYTDAAQHLAALKIMKGDSKGNLMLDKGVTRYQTALFFVQALTGKTDVAIWNAEKKSAIFGDVIEYGTAIDYAYGVNLIKGRGNGVYGYNDPILYQDMIVMAIRALGYETADMQYPYGHILAAQKLNLLDDIDLVNYKAELKRGETAQLIWNMMNTEIAVVDPITDKVLYPGETGLTDAIAGTGLVERTTLLEQSGFANSKVETTIALFTDADKDDKESVATITLGNGWEIAASDLGITADTHKVTYLGLPVTIYIDCEEDNFESLYEDEEASIVFADFAEYTVVENLGNAGNIKYVPNTSNPLKSYISLNGEKFTEDKYSAEVYVFTEDGWEKVRSDEALAIAENFLYDSKNGYVTEEGNSYGKVAYRVTDNVITVDGDERQIVEMLYTPYEFGQYITRTLVSSATGKKTTYSILGTYKPGYENIDGEVTDFAETFIGSGAAVTSGKVSKSKGDLAKNVTIEGEGIQSGEFMFYAYNQLDNILTVAQNVGSISTGRLTGTSESKETVRIGGKNFEFGFDGVYEALVSYNKNAVKAIIDALEVGHDNVKYLAVDGNIVYIAAYEGEKTSADYDFAIISTDTKLMADLLNLTETKYKNALTDGLYLKDGYVAVAVLDTENGKWKLGYIEAVAVDYDVDEDEFTELCDIGTMAKYTSILTDIRNKAQYESAKELLNDGLVMVVEKDNDVYTFASIDTVDADGEYLVDRYGNLSTGLTFNTTGRTNLIKATSDPDVSTARITTNKDSVIVVIGTDAIAVRTGVQTAKKNVNVSGDTYAFYAASSDLIVMTTTGTIDGWGKGSVATADEAYYVVLPDTSVEYGVGDEEDEYTLTIEDLFDMKTLKTAKTLVVSGTFREIQDIQDAIETGAILYLNEDGELTATDKDYAEVLVEILGEDYTVVDGDIQFVDHESIDITVGRDTLESTNALANITVNVITLDLTGNDWTDYDMDTMYVGDGTEFEYEYDGITAIEIDGKEMYNYVLSLDDVVTEITDPTPGIYDQFEIDMAGKVIEVYTENADEYDGEGNFVVSLYTIASFNDKADSLTMYVVKVLTND